MGGRGRRAIALGVVTLLLGCRAGPAHPEELSAEAGGRAAGTQASVVAPYTNHPERQNARLAECRRDLRPSASFESSTEFLVYGQATALICELAARERGLPADPGREAASDAQIDALLLGIVKRLIRGVGVGSHAGVRTRCRGRGRAEGSDCFRNIVIARYAAFFSAYVLHRFPGVAWTDATRNTAHALFARGGWNPFADMLGNSTVPLVGMRLLAGESFGDAVLFERGRSQLYTYRDLTARRGLGEPMAPHYAGMTLAVLAMLSDLSDPEVRGVVEDLLALSLLIPAHLYLPGGGLGAPQGREKTGGGIADPDPTEAPHLIPALNLLVYDPQLMGAGHPAYALASSYQAPEIIRSIFLDKGAGYGFEYRPTAPDRGRADQGWYSSVRGYPSTGRGLVRPGEAEVLANPWASVMLPDGRAQMGVMYGSGSRKANTAGLYVRKPGPLRGGRARDFSILYQHQPRRPPNVEAGPWYPLRDDPTWRWERKSHARRMLYGRTALALFDVGPKGGPEFRYTLVHVPNFANPRVGDGMREVASRTLPGHRWLVGRSGSAYVAYLPLGRVTERREMAGGDDPWILLKLGGRVSGGITELATQDEFESLDDYARDLADRHVAYRNANAAGAWVELDVHTGDGTRRIRLDFAGDLRSVDGAPVSAADFLLLGGLVRSPFVHWDDVRFELTVTRDGYAPLVLDFGDSRIPTAPTRPRVSLADDGAVRLRWEHGYDDRGIESYEVYRDGEWVGSVGGDTNRYDDPLPRRRLESIVRYTVVSRDGDGNASATPSPSVEVHIPAAD